MNLYTIYQHPPGDDTSDYLPPDGGIKFIGYQGLGVMVRIVILIALYFDDRRPNT